MSTPELGQEVPQVQRRLCLQNLLRPPSELTCLLVEGAVQMRGTWSNSPGVVGHQDSAKVWGRMHLWQSGRHVSPSEDAVGRRLEAGGESSCTSVDFPRLSKAPPSCRRPRLTCSEKGSPLPDSCFAVLSGPFPTDLETSAALTPFSFLHRGNHSSSQLAPHSDLGQPCLGEIFFSRIS